MTSNQDGGDRIRYIKADWLGDNLKTRTVGTFGFVKKLGEGCFGEVWEGKAKHNEDHPPVAIKIEIIRNDRTLQLEHEVTVLKTLQGSHGTQGVTKYHHYEAFNQGFSAVVMEMLWTSLEDLKQQCHKFDKETTALVAQQAIYRLEYLHSKGMIHRDIRPEKFMFGLKEKMSHLYLIDFGLSMKWFDGNKHIRYKEKLSLVGTPRYTSINSHKGVQQSRRDDLEAVGYMLAYLLKGDLPWTGLDGATQQQKYENILEKKQNTDVSDLCSGFKPLEEYLNAVKKLEFKQRPKYSEYQTSFLKVTDPSNSGKLTERPTFPWLDNPGLMDMLKFPDLCHPVPQPDPQPDPQTVAQPSAAADDGSRSGGPMRCCAIL